MLKKYLSQVLLALALSFAALPGQAAILVSNVWNNNVRTYPAFNNTNSPYSEMGVDYNGSGDIESAWFFTGASGTAMTATPGHLTATVGANSSSMTTYFTREGSEVNLAIAGDQLKITWGFTPTTVNSGSTSSSGLRIAVVDSPVRLTSDGSPASSTYAGYAIFMNMATTLGSSSPFQLMERIAPGTSSAFLSSGTSWTTLTNGATSGNTGYASGTQYTLVMTFTRNAASGLDILATMTGGSLNNTGSISVAYTDSTPNSFTFDTFGLRPTSSTDSAATFDTSLFKAESTTADAAPSINSQPLDQSVLVGETAVLTVDADGSAPLAYQWYFNTNTLVLNATNATLTFTNAQLTNSGDYSVVITNASGSVTSEVATLTVSLPTRPSIVTQPQGQTVLPGQTATFNVVAGGTAPLSYQWYFNTNTLLTNATSPTLTLTNVQATNVGFYSVTITNLAGTTNSASTLLALNTNPVAPTFTTQPSSLVVLLGGTANFSAVAGGTTPIYYQWFKNGSPIAGATTSSLSVTNVQTTNAGNYTVTASNSVSTAASATAVLTVTTSVPIANSAFNLAGFAQGTTGGGVIPETDAAYRKVYTPLDLANAIVAANKTAGAVKVIEIMNDLDLGWNEVGAAVQTLGSSPFRAHAAPQLHPRLLTTGVSLIDIKPKGGGVTIFSTNGATIRHACFNVKSTANIIIRNLKFDEMWEWDEASKGNYDKNDWDFIDLGNGGTVTNIWIDHCTFTKAYDGQVDIKQGSSGVTFSWCKYTGDDGATNPNSWVRQQISSLESNKTSYAFYNFLRTRGFSVEDIVTISQGHDKTHLIGANSLKAENALHTITFHHAWFNNPWDRLPRLRAGNVHNYNIYVDDTLGLAAKRLRDARANALSTADRNTLNNTYNFNPFLNGSISTENGAVLVEKSFYKDCITPLRNNQTDPANAVYTGKIKALDTIYQFDDTIIRGNSTDPGNPLGPFQAPVIAFSWNLPGGVLPYAFTPDDPSQLPALLAAGAGAGVLTWNKTNWLLTSYAPTAPVIAAQPQAQTVATNSSATFTVVAAGSTPLVYQWYFNTNTLIAGATNAAYTLNTVKGTNVGTYSVIVTNAAGSAASSNALLAISSGTYAKPQVSGLAYTNGTFKLTINGDAGPNYIVQASTNLTTWTSLYTNLSPTPPFVWTDSTAGNFVRRFYRIQLEP
jgi:pectate lyase